MTYVRVDSRITRESWKPIYLMTKFCSSRASKLSHFFPFFLARKIGKNCFFSLKRVHVGFLDNGCSISESLKIELKYIKINLETERAHSMKIKTN